MNLARDVERRLERLVEGISATLFGGKLRPIDLADRLVREADLAMSEGPAGSCVPNDFTITLHPDDLVPDLDRHELQRELAGAIEAAAIDRGWRLEGPVTVHLASDEAAVANAPRWAATTTQGPLPRWGHLLGEAGTLTLELRHNRELLGRGPGTDLNLPHAEISRNHALLWREAGRAWIQDLGSANGTLLNGIPLSEPAPIEPGDLIAIGPVDFTYRPG